MIVGIGESLHNMGLGLMLLVIATIATVVGRSRRGAKDPHKP